VNPAWAKSATMPSSRLRATLGPFAIRERTLRGRCRRAWAGPWRCAESHRGRSRSAVGGRALGQAGQSGAAGPAGLPVRSADRPVSVPG
jgi:hypothetical protein